MKRNNKLVSVSLVMAVVYAFSGCSKPVSTEISSEGVTETTEESIVEMSASEETEVNIYPTETYYRDVKANDIITFGSYPQEKDGTVKPIEWIVLDVQDGQALLLSKYGLDCQPYDWYETYDNEHPGDNLDEFTWEICSLRAWLNDDFLNTAFTDDDQSLIIETTLTTQSSEDGSEHIETDDMVFLLSYNDAYKYFDDDYSRICYATDYIVDDINWCDKYVNEEVWGKTYEPHSNCAWYLRSPGENMRTVRKITSTGHIIGASGVIDRLTIIHEDGTEEYLDYISQTAVRPAIYVDASAFPISQTIYSDEQLSDKSSVVINEENFPDDAFRELISSKYDTDEDGILVIQEIMTVTEMVFIEKNIYDLKGIEHFKYLEKLDVSKNHLSGTLDFGPLNKLVSFTMTETYGSETIHLVFKNNRNLETIKCNESKIDSIDLEGCENLISLSCPKNNITTLDLHELINLEELNCNNNNLTVLDLHELTNIENLNCGNNNLTALDLSFNTKLKNLYCYNNTINGIDLKNNAALEIIQLGASNINTSGLNADTPFTKTCNSIGDLDLSHCNNLKILSLCDCQLNSLNISGCLNIKELDITNNPGAFDKIQWTKLDNLKMLKCQNSGVSDLDVSKFPALISLYCSHNNLTYLDISNSKITSLDCSYNQLSSLKLNKRIWELNCSDNRLTSLDLSGLPYILAYCYHNNIDYIDISGTHIDTDDAEHWNEIHGVDHNDITYNIEQAGNDYYYIYHYDNGSVTELYIDEDASFIY